MQSARLNPTTVFLMALTLLLAVCAPFTIGMFRAQDPAVPVPRLRFEAASIRIISAGQLIKDRLPLGLQCRGIDGEVLALPIDPPSTAPLGRCTGVVVGHDLLVWAFGSANDTDLRTINLPDEFGLPSGPDGTLYEIQAIAPDPARTTKAELQEMLQALLRDRFDFKAHYETRDVQGFQITVAKGGIKFKETLLDEERCCRFQPPAPGAPTATVEGGISTLMVRGRFSMGPFAQFVSRLISRDRPAVADKTNLPGVYDITLLLNQLLPRNGGAGKRGGGGARDHEYDPSLAKALEEQLGLHLEAAKVSAKYLIIDHIERPSPN